VIAEGLIAFRASTMTYEKVTVREWTASHEEGPARG
jgi:hypothetical protein